MTYKDLYNFMQHSVTYTFSMIYETDYEFETFVKSMNPFYNVDGNEEYFKTFRNYVNYIDEDLEDEVSLEDGFSTITDFLADYSPSSVVDAVNGIPRDEFIEAFNLYEKSLV